MTRLGSVEHLLAVNDIRVRVERACRDLGWKLHLWLEPEELVGLLKAERTTPDGFFLVRRIVDGVERTAAFSLELERVAKSREVLRSKLRRYGDFYYSGRYERAFRTKSLRLLVVFCPPHGASAAGLVKAANEEAKKLGVTIARFADLHQLRAVSPVACLREPLWSAPAQTRPVALFKKEEDDVASG